MTLEQYQKAIMTHTNLIRLMTRETDIGELHKTEIINHVDCVDTMIDKLVKGQGK